MKLTTKGRYAVMAMADLASFQSDKPVSLNDISLRQNISLSYLEQLFAKLKNGKLVKSVRGPSGGYVLDKNPKEIKLSNIIFVAPLAAILPLIAVVTIVLLYAGKFWLNLKYWV